MNHLFCIVLFLISGCSVGQFYGSDDKFDLHYKINSLDISIGGDLNSKTIPRIDANLGETYFQLRADYDLKKKGLFLESFQGSNVILKSPTKSSSNIWDGVWLRPGAYYQLENWTIEAGPVYYMYSASRRSAQWGALFSFAVPF